MNSPIYKSTLKKIFEQAEQVLEPYIVKLFKFLNEEKKKHKTRAALLDVIKNITPYMGVPKGYELYLLELYLLNYRKDGDYKNLTKQNFVDPRKMKGKTTSNTKADLYTIAQLPFKGSNLEGYWARDNKNTPYYVVVSYGWFPIYIFKEGRWYEIVDRYSSSTGRQMRNANPVAWDENINENVFLLSREEMKMLQRGANHQDILDNKLKTIKSLEPELQSKRLRSAQYRPWWGEEGPNFKAKFKIKSVDIENGVAIVTVDIHDVVLAKNNRGINTPQNYLKGEIEGLTAEKVEEKIEDTLKHDFKQFVGPRFRWHEKLPEGSKVKFKFNHLKK